MQGFCFVLENIFKKNLNNVDVNKILLVWNDSADEFVLGNIFIKFEPFFGKFNKFKESPFFRIRIDAEILVIIKIFKISFMLSRTFSIICQNIKMAKWRHRMIL